MPKPFDPNDFDLPPGFFDLKKEEGDAEDVAPKVAPYQPARQFAAGYLDTLLPVPGTYVPGGVYQALGAVEGVANYISSVSHDLGPSDDSAIGKMLPRTTTEPYSSTLYQDLAASGMEQANEITGAVPPRNTLELGLRMSAIIPGLSKLPMALKLFVPAVQSETKVGRAVEIAAQTAVGDVVADIVDPTYQSIGETFSSEDPAQAVGTVDPALPMAQPDDEFKTSTIISGAVWGGLAAIAGTSAFRAMQASKRVDEAIAASETLGARKSEPAILGNAPTPVQKITPKTENVSRAAAVGAELIDRDIPLFEVLNAAGRSDLVDRWRLSVQPSLATKMQNVVETGLLPNGTKTVPLAAHYQKLKDLSPAEYAEYADTRNFLTVQDTMLAKNQTMWFGNSFADITAKIHRAKSNPKIAALVDESNKFFRDFLSYMKDEGIIDQRTYNDYYTRTYSPTQALEESDIGKAMRGKNYDGGRHLLERELQIKPGEFAAPHQIDFHWINNMARLIEHNSVRRDVVDVLSNIRRGGSGGMLASRGKMDDSAILIARNGKREAWHIHDPVIDSVVRMLPETNQHWIFQSLANGSKLGMMLETGVGNPLFAGKAAVYDMLAAYTNAQPGRAVGPIDEALRRTTGYTLSDMGIPRFDAPLAPIAGFARRSYGRAVQHIASTIRDSIPKNGAIATLLGPQRSQQLVDLMTDAALNSSVGWMERTGADSAVFLDTTQAAGTRTTKSLSKASPDFARKYDTTISGQLRAHPFVRLYNDILSGIHKSTKTQFFAANLDRKLVTKQVQIGNRVVPMFEFAPSGTPVQLNRLANETRKLSGDTARVAGAHSQTGTVVQVLQNITPWGRIGIQAGREFYNAAREHPFRTGVSMAALGTAVLATASNLSPEMQEEYFNRWTPEQRARGIPIEVNGELIGVFSFEPQHRMFLGPLIEAFGTVAGYKGEPNPALQAAFKHALSSQDWNEVASVVPLAFDEMLRDKSVTDIQSSLTSGVKSVLPPWLSFGTDNPAIRAGSVMLQAGGSTLKKPFEAARFGDAETYSTQNRSDPFDPRDPTTGDVVRAMVSELLMSAGQVAIDMWDAAAYPNQNMYSKANSVSDALVARYRQPSTQNVFAGLLPTDPQRLSRYTSETKMLLHKRKVLGEITNIYNAHLSPATQVQGTSGLDRPRMTALQPLPSELMYAAGIAKAANTKIANEYEATTALLRRADELRGNYKIPAATKQRMMNTLTMQIQDNRAKVHDLAKSLEAHIQSLGYRDFDELYERLQEAGGS